MQIIKAAVHHPVLSAKKKKMSFEHLLFIISVLLFIALSFLHQLHARHL